MRALIIIRIRLKTGKEDSTDNWLTLKFSSETPYSFDHLSSLSLTMFFPQHSKSSDVPERKKESEAKCLQFKEDCKENISWVLNRVNSGAGASIWTNFLWVAMEKGMNEREQGKSRRNRAQFRVHLDRWSLRSQFIGIATMSTLLEELSHGDFP